MSLGLKFSTIETFRKRTHGSSVLNLYGLAPDGDSLELLFTVTQGFVIGRNADTQEGAPEHNLTIDTILTPNLTVPQLERVYMVGLYNPATGVEQRYAKTTMTEPLIDDWRYVCGLHPRYNDAKAVL